MATGVPSAPLPRSTSPDRRQPKGGRGNFELYAWVFMRISGVLLVFLVLAIPPVIAIGAHVVEEL